MEGVWADEYEDDDFLDYYGEAEEVPEPSAKRTKLLDEDPNAKPKEPKKTRIVQNPRPKLDTDRLLTEDNGIPELLREVVSIKFKEGREIQDMKRTLQVMHMWSHRLFPKFTFDDFLARCEVLGKKRPIKTHLRKVRTGMIPI